MVFSVLFTFPANVSPVSCFSTNSTFMLELAVKSICAFFLRYTSNTIFLFLPDEPELFPGLAV